MAVLVLGGDENADENADEKAAENAVGESRKTKRAAYI